MYFFNQSDELMNYEPMNHELMNQSMNFSQFTSNDKYN